MDWIGPAKMLFTTLPVLLFKFFFLIFFFSLAAFICMRAALGDSLRVPDEQAAIQSASLAAAPWNESCK